MFGPEIISRIERDGGTIETSGHSVDFTGINVSASAAHGAAGTWRSVPGSF